MRKIVFEFIFHNVGQGLFYSGKISYFNFVYDCGSKPETSYLEREIVSYLDSLERATLDMLVISHFHDDHINGLNRLLKDIKLETVFIPYFSPLERLFFIIHSEGLTIQSEDNEILLNFLADPLAFLDNKGAKNIFMFLSKGGNEEEITIDKIEHKSRPNEELKAKIDKERGKNPYKNIKLIEFISDKSKIRLASIWKFKFYFFQDKEFTKKIDKFKAELKSNGIKIETPDDIKNIIKDKELVKKVKIIHTKVWKKNELNSTSLVLYHTPLIPFCYFSLELKTDNGFYYFNARNNLFHKKSSEIYGQLLTGDIPLKGSIFDDFRKHYEDELETIIAILVPHHGSIDNWDNKIIADTCDYYVSSSGFSNNHFHPNLKVVKSVVNKHKYFLECNEINKIKIKYYGYLPRHDDCLICGNRIFY